ncbi:MAG: hypothetical protein ACSLE1_11065 [Sphingobium sp.]
MLQADCAPITTPRFHAPTISSEIVSESINGPRARWEDPAVCAWRAWRDARLAFEASDGTSDDDATMAETALVIAQPMTLEGALAKLRGALTFIGDFDGWVRNIALDQVAPEDAAVRAKDMTAPQMVASVIDLLAATLSADGAEPPCTEDVLTAEGVGGWNARYAAWELRVALRQMSATIGALGAAEERHAALRSEFRRQYGTDFRTELPTEQQALLDAEWENVAKAENAHWMQYGIPAEQAAAEVLATPAPTTEAITKKIHVVIEHELHNSRFVDNDPIAIIHEDCVRLGIEVPR